MVSSPPPTSASAPSAALAAPGALEPDQLELVGLAGQLGARLVVADHAAREGLALLDDLLHLLVDAAEVLGGERGLDVEVVVEAVVDRRADAELGVGVELLHRLRHHVGRRVPQDRQPVGAVDGHRLDDVTGLDDVRQVLELAADARGDDRPVVLPQHLRGRRAGGDRSLAAVDGDLQVWHGRSSSVDVVMTARCYRPTAPRLARVSVAQPQQLVADRQRAAARRRRRRPRGSAWAA